MSLAGIEANAVAEVNSAREAAIASPEDPAKVAELGMYLYAMQQSLPAAACFERATSLDPQNPRWWYYLGAAWQLSYENAKAINAYERVLQLKPDYEPAMVLLGELVEKENPTKAAALYNAAFKLNPNDPVLCLKLGIRAEKAGDMSGSLRYFRRALDIYPEYAGARAAIVKVLKKQGKKEDARREEARQDKGSLPPIFTDPLMLDLLIKTRNLQYLLRVADQLTATGQFDRGAQWLRRALEVTPNDNGEVRENLAIVFAMQGNMAQAISEFNSIIKQFPGRLSARMHLGQALAQQKRYDEALAQYAKIVELDDSDPDFLREFGALLLKLGQCEKAMSALTRVTELRPEDPAPYYDVAAAFICEHKIGRAIQSFAQAQQREAKPGDAAAILLIRVLQLIQDQKVFGAPNPLTVDVFAPIAEGMRRQKMKVEAEAAKVYLTTIAQHAVRRAQEGNARSAEAILRSTLAADNGGVLAGALGTVLAFQERYQEAIEAFREASEAAPNSRSAKVNLAAMLSKMNRFDEARAILELLRKDEPDDELLLLQVVSLAERGGKLDEAKSLLEVAAQKNPQSREIAVRLGRILAREGKYADAIGCYRRAVQNHPRDSRLRHELASAIAGTGDSKAAIAEWEASIQIDPENAEARLSLAGAIAKQKDFAKAIETLRDGLALRSESPEFNNGLAWLLATCPNPDLRYPVEAIRLADKACRLTGNHHPKLVDTLATAYAADGKFERAVELERQAIQLAQESKAPDSLLTELKQRLDLFLSQKPYIAQD